MLVPNFEEVEKSFLLDVVATIAMNEIPHNLILNWDQTGLHIVPGTTWTSKKQGTKHVKIAGLE